MQTARELSTASGPGGEALARCIQRAIDHLLAIQADAGYWWAELESNVTMAAEHLLLEQFLGIDEQGRRRKIARYLLQLQQPDGSWPIYYGGPGDVSIGVEAYFALKLAGVDADEPPMRRAREFILAGGGIGRARIFTKLWLALFGQFDWQALPAMPPEAILLPPSCPLNIYAFSSWARATIVPILILRTYQPVMPIPDGARV
ncbi:MAG TPA: squalene--hopene cyclase, partial [Dehalococcoidia bacterium]